MRSLTERRSGYWIGGAIAALAQHALLMTAAAAVFSDTEFELAEWNITPETFGAGGTVSPSHELAGGNPGGHLRYLLDLHDSAQPQHSRLNVLAVDQDALFFPNGAQSLRFSFAIDYSWRILEEPAPAPLPEMGVLFVIGCAGDFLSTGLTPAPLTATGDEWRTIFEPYEAFMPWLGSWFPNASSQGIWGIAPLEFGFYIGNKPNPDGWGLLSDLRFDNWSVNVALVPEPCTTLILLAGALLLPRRRMPAHRARVESAWWAKAAAPRRPLLSTS